MRFKKKLITWAATVFALVGISALAFGQSDYMEYLARFLNGEAVAKVRVVDDTDVAIVVDYVQAGGGHMFAKVAVEADGNLTFTQDNTDGTTASTELECPVSGALGGVIDVSDAACNTFGEVVDIINASTSWRAVLVGALRTDTYDANSILADAADFDAQAIEGDLLYWDTDACFRTSWVVSEMQDFTNFYVSAGNLKQNPWDGTRASVRYMDETIDFDSGTSTVKFYAVRPNNQAGTEVVTLLYSVAGGADGTLKNIIGLGHLGGLLGRKDEKLLVRIENSAEMSAVTQTSMVIYGTEFDSR
jgi:hypothetical protein